MRILNKQYYQRINLIVFLLKLNAAFDYLELKNIYYDIIIFNQEI